MKTLVHGDAPDDGDRATAQPVMDYVNAPDPSFRWSVTEVTERLAPSSRSWDGEPDLVGRMGPPAWILMPDNVERCRPPCSSRVASRHDLHNAGPAAGDESNQIIAVPEGS